MAAIEIFNAADDANAVVEVEQSKAFFGFQENGDEFSFNNTYLVKGIKSDYTRTADWATVYKSYLKPFFVKKDNDQGALVPFIGDSFAEIYNDGAAGSGDTFNPIELFYCYATHHTMKAVRDGRMEVETLFRHMKYKKEYIGSLQQFNQALHLEGAGNTPTIPSVTFEGDTQRKEIISQKFTAGILIRKNYRSRAAFENAQYTFMGSVNSASFTYGQTSILPRQALVTDFSGTQICGDRYLATIGISICPRHETWDPILTWTLPTLGVPAGLVPLPAWTGSSTTFAANTQWQTSGQKRIQDYYMNSFTSLFSSSVE